MMRINKKYIVDGQGNPGEVIISYEDFQTIEDLLGLEKQSESPDELLKELRNSVTEYKKPTEPVGLDDWEALR